MKLAIPYENGEIFQHFGHCENFEIFTVEDGKIQSSKVVSSAGQGHGALAVFLAEQDVKVLICGGIGGGAKAALAAARIMVFGGVTGKTRDAVQAYITGSLEFDPNANCAHHDHGGHACGSHGCGNCHGCH